MQTMPSTDADRAFLDFLDGPLGAMGPRAAFGRLIDYWRTVPAAAPARPRAEDGDALLFQFGTHDWGEGPRFEVNLTRQVIYADEEQDEIWQLGLTVSAPPSEARAALGADDRWLWNEGDGVQAFRDHVLDHDAVSALSGGPVAVSLHWSKT